MYHVIWNGKPAILENSTESIWKNHVFSTFEEAKEYAIDWLGIYVCCLTAEIVPNTPILVGNVHSYIEVNEVK